jgi:hypothetical protein
MKPFDLAIFREAVAVGRIEWRKHVLLQIAERGIPQQAGLEVLHEGEIILKSIAEGFTMDDERLKRSSGENYFEEVLAA